GGPNRDQRISPYSARVLSASTTPYPCASATDHHWPFLAYRANRSATDSCGVYGYRRDLSLCQEPSPDISQPLIMVVIDDGRSFVLYHIPLPLKPLRPFVVL